MEEIKYYACLKDSVVVQVIVCDESKINEIIQSMGLDESVNVTDLEQRPETGDTYRDGAFIKPEALQLPIDEQIKIAIKKAMDFGQQVIIEFGVANVLDGLTNEQIRELSERLAKVQSLLAAGALYSALDEAALVQTDALLPANKLKSFTNKIRSYLGLTLE